MSEIGNLRILFTGMPGCSRDPYIGELCKKCQDEGKDINVYHLFDYILEEAKKEGMPISKNTILDFYDSSPEKMRIFREIAIDNICSKILKEESVCIISSPNYFEWRGSNLDGFRTSELDKLNLDLIFIIIDDLSRIKERLSNDEQWKNQAFSYADIAKWRRDCIDKIWEYAFSKTPAIKSYVIAIEHNIDVIYDLIFNPEKPKAYLSYPITGVKLDELKEEREMAKILSPKYIIFDPLTIKDWQLVTKWKEIKDSGETPENFECEIEYKDGVKKFTCNYHEIELAIKDIRHQLVDRDYKLIEHSDYVLVYHPVKSISVGVVCEMIHGKRGGQYVYAMYPYEPSPFLEYNATRIFKSKGEFLEFLDKATAVTE